MPDASDLDEGFSRDHAVLVVLGEPSRLAQPGEGSFHNPAPGKHLEDALLAALDHLHVPAKHAQRPSNQRARAAAIHEKGLQPLKA